LFYDVYINLETKNPDSFQGEIWGAQNALAYMLFPVLGFEY
jgi:hypothetical protein